MVVSIVEYILAVGAVVNIISEFDCLGDADGSQLAVPELVHAAGLGSIPSNHPLVSIFIIQPFTQRRGIQGWFAGNARDCRDAYGDAHIEMGSPAIGKLESKLTRK